MMACLSENMQKKINTLMHIIILFLSKFICKPHKTSYQ